MSLKIKGVPIQWILWHPHQRLWNWTLVKIINKLVFIKPIARRINNTIMKIDTYLLKMGLELNPKNVNKYGYSPEKTINYFDLGTHKEANELNWVAKDILPNYPNTVKIYAFEANFNSYKVAKKNTHGIKHLTFFNIALVHKIPENGIVRLYTDTDGLGDSIYRNSMPTFVDVPAKKLSDIIKEENIDLKNSINIIRMNIEGCEYDVLEDLYEHDLIKYFDGFYGMWDDVGKINQDRDREFRTFLHKQNVHPFPFNGRDMNIESRKKLIKKSLHVTITGKN